MISLRIFLLVLVTLVCREFAETRIDAVASSEILQVPAAIRTSCFVLGFGLLFKSLVTAFLAASGIQGPNASIRLGTTDAHRNTYNRALQVRRITESLWLGTLPAALMR